MRDPPGWWSHRCRYGRGTLDHGGIDRIIDGEFEFDSSWQCDVQEIRFSPAYATDGVAHFLVAIQRSSQYDRVLISCDYLTFAPLDEVPVGRRENVMDDVLPWSSNGWAMLDDFGRLETFRLD